MKKALQMFTAEYLERCSKLTPEQIIEFVENFRQLVYDTDQANKKMHSDVSQDLDYLAGTWKSEDETL